MGKVDFTPEHKSRDAAQYPKLFLEKGERARIVVVEQPSMRWVHTLRKPRIEDGRQIMETKKSFNGQERQVPAMDFVGQHFCRGTDEALASKGLDPNNCPTCEAAQANALEGIEAPKRRFGMHIIRYRTKSGSFQIQEPFSVELLAWTFADGRFDTLVDFQAEWGDLRKRDLGLGPCEVKQYQKFDIQILPKCEWLESDDRKALVSEVYRHNQIPGALGIDGLMARDLPADQMQQDVDRVLDAYSGTNTERDEKGDTDPLPVGDMLNGILDSPDPEPVTKAYAEAQEPPWTTEPARAEPQEQSAQSTRTTRPTRTPQPPAGSEQAKSEEVEIPRPAKREVDFDELLGSL